MRKQLLQLSKRKGKITPAASAPRAKSGKTRPVTLGKIGRAKCAYRSLVMRDARVWTLLASVQCVT